MVRYSILPDTGSAKSTLANFYEASEFTGRPSDNSSDGRPVFSAPLFDFLLPEADNEA
jgi:hypothetical protein